MLTHMWMQITCWCCVLAGQNVRHTELTTTVTESSPGMNSTPIQDAHLLRYLIWMVFSPFACIERKWTGGEWWLCLHVKVTLGNSLARQKLAWLFSKRSHWPQDIWVKMDSISVSLLQTLYANSTLCKCVVFVYSKRGGFKCLCPLEPLHSLWIALSQLAQLYSCAIVVRVAWVSWSTLTLWAVLENLWQPRREVIS